MRPIQSGPEWQNWDGSKQNIFLMQIKKEPSQKWSSPMWSSNERCEVLILMRFKQMMNDRLILSRIKG